MESVSRAARSSGERKRTRRRRRVTRRRRDFAAEGFPAWSAAHAGARIPEEETFPARVDRDAHEPRRDTRAARAGSNQRRPSRRTGATRHRRETTAPRRRRGGTKNEKNSLDSFDELLAACVRDLPLLDTPRSRRRAGASRKPRSPSSRARWGRARGPGGSPPRRRCARGDDLEPCRRPDPACRLGTAGRGRGSRGVAWHVRVPLVARVIQRKATSRVCRRRRALRTASCSARRRWSGRGSPSGPRLRRRDRRRYTRERLGPVRVFPRPRTRGRLRWSRSSGDAPGGERRFPVCDRPGASRRQSRESRSRRWSSARWVGRGRVRVRDGGQFEWVDGRTLRARVNGEAHRWGARMIPFTRVKPRRSTLSRPPADEDRDEGVETSVRDRVQRTAGGPRLDGRLPRQRTARGVRAAVGLRAPVR